MELHGYTVFLEGPFQSNLKVGTYVIVSPEQDVSHTAFVPIGLQKYWEYSVSVAARTEFGEGPYSIPTLVRTLENGNYDVEFACMDEYT